MVVTWKIFCSENFVVNNLSLIYLMISCSSFPSFASYGDHSEAEFFSEVLKEQEEEYRRQIELEDEERKLEKTLEYQRRIENEAKEKLIAEQQKKYSSLVPMNVAEAVYNVCTDNVVAEAVYNLNLQEQDLSISQVTIE